MANGTIAFDTLTTSDSKGGGTEKSIDTSYVYNGVGKVFMRAPGDKASIQESFNVSSLDDDGTGDFGINYTNNFARTTHFPMVHIPSGGSAGNSDGHFCECNSSLTSSGEYQAWYGDAGTNLTFTDWATAHATFGELA
jgi:hypothetical protein